MRTLDLGTLEAGPHGVTWDGLDARGHFQQQLLRARMQCRGVLVHEQRQAAALGPGGSVADEAELIAGGGEVAGVELLVNSLDVSQELGSGQLFAVLQGS